MTSRTRDSPGPSTSRPGSPVRPRRRRPRRTASRRSPSRHRRRGRGRRWRDEARRSLSPGSTGHALGDDRYPSVDPLSTTMISARSVTTWDTKDSSRGRKCGPVLRQGTMTLSSAGLASRLGLASPSRRPATTSFCPLSVPRAARMRRRPAYRDWTSASFSRYRSAPGHRTGRRRTRRPCRGSSLTSSRSHVSPHTREMVDEQAARNGPAQANSRTFRGRMPTARSRIVRLRSTDDRWHERTRPARSNVSPGGPEDRIQYRPSAAAARDHVEVFSIAYPREPSTGSARSHHPVPGRTRSAAGCPDVVRGLGVPAVSGVTAAAAARGRPWRRMLKRRAGEWPRCPAWPSWAAAGCRRSGSPDPGR